jgi:hypothetical protein
MLAVSLDAGAIDAGPTRPAWMGSALNLSRFPPPSVHNAAMIKQVQVAFTVLLVILAGVMVWQGLRSQDRSRKEYASC